MKKGQVYIGTVEEFVFPNKGIIYYEEKPGTEVSPADNVSAETMIHKIVVKDALPGETVRFQLSKKRSGKYEGRLLEVLSKGEIENAVPECPHFGTCGGCSFQTLSYENQLKLKSGMVRSILDSVLEKPYEFEGIIGSPREWGYRNKMEFSFGDACKGGELSLGMHKKGSFYDIVTTDNCKIVHEDYNLILKTVLDYFRERAVPFYHKMSKEGYLRHLLLRRAVKTGEMTISLVTTSSLDPDLSDLVELLLNLNLEGRIAGILHIFNDGLADMVRSDRTEVLYGSEYFYEEILGLKFKISTFSFFQTNSLGAEKLYEKAREYVGETKDKLIFDLYSGTGTIAQMLAAVAKKVIGVEIVEEAVEAARENAKLNGLENCEFIAGDVLKVIDEIEEKPDLIVLDPPRDGIHSKALEKIINYGVEKIVYISCKPTSLARDLEVLTKRGYEVVRGCAVDMFPGTHHVETVVMLSHKKPDSVINVKVEFGEGEGKVPLDNIAKRAEAYKPKERVTYKMIKEYIEAKYGFKVHTAYIAEVKRELGLPMYDAPDAVEELKQPRKHPTAEKAEAIKDALKHFEVI